MIDGKKIQKDLVKAKFAVAKGIDPRKIYSIEDAIKILGLSERTIWRMMKDGRLIYFHVKGSKKIEFLGEWIIGVYENKVL